MNAMRVYDTIVVGLGAMGSATLYQLACRKVPVLGLDRYAPPHAHGSTHGDTRVTRLAIGEGDHLTPLVMRSHELWRSIEAETDAELLTTCGELIISSSVRTAKTHQIEDFFGATCAAAERFGIAHEHLTAAEIRERFPQFAVRDNEVGYFEPDAGVVRPEACVQAQLELAKRHGADIRTHETVLDWRSDGEGVRVVTDKAQYMARRLVLAAGPWLPQLLTERLARPFRVLRQVLYWFDVPRHFARFVPERCPVFIWELQEQTQVIYGVPAVDGPRGGIKIATEQYEAETTPDAIERHVSAEETQAMYERFVAPYLPDVGPACVKTASCLYTMTPDSGFVIDRHPDCDAVFLLSACSGHGFKHSAAIGEAVAQWVLDEAGRADLSPFRLDRMQS